MMRPKASILFLFFSFTLLLTSHAGSSEEKRLPLELEILADRYETDIARATKPITDAHLKELEALKMRFAKAGKLDEAVIVDERIEALRKAEDPIYEIEDETRWKWSSGGELRLYGDGKATHTKWRNKTGSWKAFDRDSIKLFHPNGHIFDVHFETRSEARVVPPKGLEAVIELKE